MFGHITDPSLRMPSQIERLISSSVQVLRPVSSGVRFAELIVPIPATLWRSGTPAKSRVVSGWSPAYGVWQLPHPATWFARYSPRATTFDVPSSLDPQPTTIKHARNVACARIMSPRRLQTRAESREHQLACTESA